MGGVLWQLSPYRTFGTRPLLKPKLEAQGLLWLEARPRQNYYLRWELLLQRLGTIPVLGLWAGRQATQQMPSGCAVMWG